MAEETAYAARVRKEAAADECLTTLLDGLKAFFEGKAALHISPTIGSASPTTGHAVRFVKDTPRS